MRLLGIDPGTQKVGIAVLDDAGSALYRTILTPEALVDALRSIISEFAVDAIVLGSGTRSGAIADGLAALGLPCHLVDEASTTLEARRLYFEANPPRGWRRLVPRGMLLPPGPIDDFAAELIARRFSPQL